MLPCMNKQLFGIECPSCGTQRAFFSLLEGNFTEAFTTFPAIYTLIAFFVVLALHFIDKTRSYTTLIKWLAIVNGVIMIVSYLIKISQTL